MNRIIIVVTSINDTPGGTRTTFASGLNEPIGLAFNSVGVLFEADWGSGNNGTNSHLARNCVALLLSGLHNPAWLAFDNTGNLFEADFGQL